MIKMTQCENNNIYFGEEMDKKIKKIEKMNKKEGQQLKQLEKMDKKHDKIVDRAKMKKC